MKKAKFHLKPIVSAVHRALAEGNFRTDVKRSAPMVKQTTRKTPVRWTRAEIKAIVTEILPIMEKHGVKFPIGENDHISPKKYAVKPLVLAAQKKLFPPERRISDVGVSTPLQHLIRKRLNQYHYKNRAAAKKLLGQAEPVKVVTGSSGDPKALGEMVGNFLTSDREVLKSFLTGLVSAIATK